MNKDCLAPTICRINESIICVVCLKRMKDCEQLINLIKKGSMKLEWKCFMLDALDGSGLTTEEIQEFMTLSERLGLDA
jgi:hypothetical protein